LLVVLSNPHGLSTPALDIYFGADQHLACSLIGRLHVAGELLNLFWWLKPRVRCSPVSARIRRPAYRNPCSRGRFASVGCLGGGFAHVVEREQVMILRIEVEESASSVSCR
jgi:hypothetical protein